MKEIKTDKITINCGESLLIYLKEKGLNIDHFYGIPGSENSIYLPDSTTINWRSREGKVRINCTEQAKNNIENKTRFSMFENGVGDPTRPFSFLVDNQRDLDLIIEALKN